MSYHCRECGKELTWNGLYCSNKCQEAARQKRDGEPSHNDLKHTVTLTRHRCTECGQELEVVALRSGKPTRQTCSAKCRKARSRRVRDAQSAWIGALHELSKVRDLIKRGEHNSETGEQLRRLKDEINDLLMMVKDADELAKRALFERRARAMHTFKTHLE